MLELTAFGGGFVSSKVTVKGYSTEMLQREQIMRGNEHWLSKCVIRLPFSPFSCLATTQQRLVTSPRDPGVVRLHVNAGQFSTTAGRVTSPTRGPPPPYKQALTATATVTLTVTVIVTAKVTVAITIAILKLTPPVVDGSFRCHFIQSKKYLNVTLRCFMRILCKCFERCGAH